MYRRLRRCPRTSPLTNPHRQAKEWIAMVVHDPRLEDNIGNEQADGHLKASLEGGDGMLVISGGVGGVGLPALSAHGRKGP